MITEAERRRIEMLFTHGKPLDERWLLRQGKVTKEQLDELVAEGFLVRIDRDSTDTMSDNKYMLR